MSTIPTPSTELKKWSKERLLEAAIKLDPLNMGIYLPMKKEDLITKVQTLEHSTGQSASDVLATTPALTPPTPPPSTPAPAGTTPAPAGTTVVVNQPTTTQETSSHKAKGYLDTFVRGFKKKPK